MMADSLPYLQWYSGDFMRSTRGWSVTAKGVYRELLDAQWDSPDLPADPDALRGLIGATEAEWVEGWRRCESKFPEVAPGVRRNARLEEHRADAVRRRELRANAGRVGGKASAQAKAKQTSTIAQANVNPPSSSSSSSSSSSPTSEKISDRAARRPRSQGEPSEFAALKAAYPRRSGSQRWGDALKHCRARIAEGRTWRQLLEGAERYAAFMRATGKDNSEFVQQAATFFGRNLGFTEQWQAPAAPGKAAKSPEQVAEDRKLAERAQRTRDKYVGATDSRPAQQSGAAISLPNLRMVR